MPSAKIDAIPAPEREMLTDLRLSDEQTNGHPVLPPDRVDRAREWLSRVVTDGRDWQAHLALLCKLYQGRFLCPVPRRLAHGERWAPPDVAEGFRHDQPLPAEEARILVETGLAAYPPDRLALLLLNPVALWDLIDLIDYVLPEYWRPLLEQRGQELIEEHGLDFPIPSS